MIVKLDGDMRSTINIIPRRTTRLQDFVVLFRVENRSCCFGVSELTTVANALRIMV